MTASHRRRGGLVALAACAVLAAAGCTAPDPAPPAGPGAATASAASPAATPAGACGAKVVVAQLPEWARAGFSGDAVAPHVLGARGDIAAVLFGNPLTVDRKDGASNKILWVSREPIVTPDKLVITGRRDGSAETVVREVPGGPGPSIIDFPQAGCWRLELSWSGRTDTMELVYAAG